MTEPTATGVIFWDFDRTLAYRTTGWSGALHELLVEHDRASAPALEIIQPLLATGWPWHTPDVAHPELCEPDQWWACMEQTFTRIYTETGLLDEAARTLSSRVRGHYLTPGHWTVYEDTWP